MNGAKRNRSPRKVGHGRGVPMRLLRGISKKYSLGQIIVWTYDTQRRQRILVYGSKLGPALLANSFAKEVCKLFGWPKDSAEWELSCVRRLKDRIRELETALAQIADGEKDARGLARAAGKFTDESDGGNLGVWVFISRIIRKRPTT